MQPADYVRWEYLSRQRLLATQIASFRDHPPARVLDIGCGNGALSMTLSEAAGFDLIAMDILPIRTGAIASPTDRFMDEINHGEVVYER